MAYGLGELKNRYRKRLDSPEVQGTISNPLVAKALPLADILVMELQHQREQMSGTFLETVYEQVREETFPDRPSRLGGVFLFPTVEDASVFQRRQRGRIQQTDQHLLNTRASCC